MEEFSIRKFEIIDENDVIALWKLCNLVVPQNNPKKDIEEKMNFQPELFFVGEFQNNIIASIMIGYDGHRGWLYYLAVHPDFQRRGFGTQLIDFARDCLSTLGCQKINVQIRTSNASVASFYKRVGFFEDHVFGLGKRIKKDS